MASPAVRQLLLSGRVGPVFLLRDEFTTAAAAPLASPRTCEPGPGTLTLVQTDGQFSVSGGKLVFPAQATPAWGDQGFYGGPVARMAGRALLATLNQSSGSFTLPVKWADAAGTDYPENTLGLQVQRSGTIYASRYVSGARTDFALASAGTGTDYRLAAVLRGTGVFLLIKGGAFTNWTLLWVGDASSVTPLYPGYTNYDAAGTFDSFRVTDLPAPWNSDYGVASDRKAGTVAAGAAFTHTADCLIEWTQTTLADYTDIMFRMPDATNGWGVETDSTGKFNLYEMIAGTPVSRATAAGVLSAGHRCMIVADGATIRGYSNNVLRWTYPSATNFVTATGGKRAPSNTSPFTWPQSGTVSDLVAWPRYPSFPSV